MTDSLVVYEALQSVGARPVLMCYGPSAGTTRLELSGKVVANHVAKIANLLSDDLLLDEGDAIEIDLPAHWRGCVWLLASALAGLELGDSDIAVVTDTPGTQAAENLIQVSLGALDLSCPNLATGWIDGVAEPLGQADILLDTSRSRDIVCESSQHQVLVDPDLATAASTLWANILVGRPTIMTSADMEDVARRENNL